MTSVGRDRPRTRPETIAETIEALCPYVAAVDGAWRATRPVREHVCTAVRPVRPIPIERQRELCLGAGHVTCQVYQRTLAARRATAEIEGMPLDRVPASRWLPSRPVVPVALDHPSTVPGLPAVGHQVRAGAQALLAAVMIVAAALLVAARLLGVGLAAPAPSASASQPAVASAPASSSPSPSPSSSASPSASLEGAASAASPGAASATP